MCRATAWDQQKRHMHIPDNVGAWKILFISISFHPVGGCASALTDIDTLYSHRLTVIICNGHHSKNHILLTISIAPQNKMASERTRISLTLKTATTKSNEFHIMPPNRHSVTWLFCYIWNLPHFNAFSAKSNASLFRILTIFWKMARQTKPNK